MAEQLDIEEQIRARIVDMHEKVPNSIGDQFRFTLVACDREAGVYTLRCKTKEWMRNPAGILHGGMGATILDQAMGMVCFCLKRGVGVCTTVQLEADYHRPIMTGESILVKVHVISVTRSLINMTAELVQPSKPDKISVSGSAIFFYKEDECAVNS